MVALDRIHALIWASTAFDAGALAGAAWLWRRRGAAHALALVVAAGAVWVLKLAALAEAGLSSNFGLARLLYLDLVVAVPVGGAALLVLGPRRTPVRAAAGAAMALAVVGVYGTFIEPHRLVTERADVRLPPGRAGERALKVAVLADLQFREVGDHERAAVRRAMSERPDVILLPGDIHQGRQRQFQRELPEIRRLLSGLRAPGGVYFVLGDAEGLAKGRRAVAGTGVRLLHDEVASVRVAGRRLTIGGIRLNWRSAPARGVIDRLERAPGAGDLRVLLAHRPDVALTLRHGTRIDLTVAGHTHGGQIAPPLVGPITVASRVGRAVGAGGLHDLGGARRVYVSRGIGMERGQAPPVRINAPPEVSLLRLR